MVARIDFRSGWQRDLERSNEMRSALRGAAREVADEAERIGREVAPSYKAEVTDEDGKVQVQANTDHINAAGWIELGTGPPAPTPAHAPLRRGADAAGLKTSKG